MKQERRGQGTAFKRMTQPEDRQQLIRTKWAQDGRPVDVHQLLRLCAGSLCPTELSGTPGAPWQLQS